MQKKEKSGAEVLLACYIGSIELLKDTCAKRKDLSSVLFAAVCGSGINLELGAGT